jgi:hypothetical protein
MHKMQLPAIADALERSRDPYGIACASVALDLRDAAR